jgi:hypothetical protein
MTDSERRIVEDYIVERLTSVKKWKFIEAKSLNRDDFSELLLIPNLINAIKTLNKDVELTEGDINRVLLELKFAPANMEGGKNCS